MENHDRLDRMHRTFGVCMERGVTCETCPHLRRTCKNNKIVTSCKLYSDDPEDRWMKKWPACSLHSHPELKPGVNFTTYVNHAWRA